MSTQGSAKRPQMVTDGIVEAAKPGQGEGDGSLRRARAGAARAFGRRFLRALCLIIFTLVISVGVAGGAWWLTEEILQSAIGWWSIPIVFGPLFVIMLALSAAAGDERPDAELAPLRAERRQLQDRLDEGDQSNIKSLVQLNLNQLSEYYMINKRQARNSYNMSLAAIVIGSAVIMTGLVSFYFRLTLDPRLSVIAALSGGLLEFIGGAYFFMYRRSLEQVNVFFGQLTRLQDTMLAIELAAELPDQHRRGAVLERVVVALLERSLKSPPESTANVDAIGVQGGVG